MSLRMRYSNEMVALASKCLDCNGIGVTTGANTLACTMMIAWTSINISTLEQSERRLVWTELGVDMG